MPFLDWVNEYRKQLEPKDKPFFKSLGLLNEAETSGGLKANNVDNNTTGAIANQAVDSAEKKNPEQPIKPNPGPTQVKPEAPKQPPAAQPAANQPNPRIQFVFETFHNTLLKNAASIDAKINSAIKAFEGHDIENYKEVRKEENQTKDARILKYNYHDIYRKELDKLKEDKDNRKLSDEELIAMAKENARQIRKETNQRDIASWDKIYKQELAKLHEKEKNKSSLRQLILKAKYLATQKVGKIANKEETNRDDRSADHRAEGHPLKKGLGFIGENAESIRLTKAIVIRVICFEMLATILGQFGAFTKIISVNDKISTALKQLEKQKAPAPEEPPADEDNKNRSEYVDEVRIEIDGEVIILEAGVIKDTVKTIGNLFSNVSGQYSSAVKLAQKDSTSVIKLLIRWFFTKQSFSTNLFGGKNAMALVDGLTNGYLHEIKTATYITLKDYFMAKLPASLQSIEDEKEFQNKVNLNAKKFQPSQGLINNITDEVLKAFIAQERLS